MRFYLFLAAAAAALIAIGAFRYSIITAERARNADEVAKQVEARRVDVVSWQSESDKRKEISDGALKTAQSEIARVTELNQSRRTKYVTTTAIKSCSGLTVGVVQLHDADAAGRAAVPDPASSVVDANSGIGIDRYSAVVGRNYGHYHAVVERLKTCESRFVAECEAWNKKWGSKTQCRANETQPAKVLANPSTAKGN